MDTLDSQTIARIRALRAQGALTRDQIAAEVGTTLYQVDKHSEGVVPGSAPINALDLAGVVALVPAVETEPGADHPNRPGQWPDKFDADAWYERAHPFQWNEDGENPFKGMDVDEFAAAISDATDTVDTLGYREDDEDEPLDADELDELAKARTVLAAAERIGDYGCSNWSCDCVPIAAQGQEECLDSTLNYLTVRHPDMVWVRTDDPTRAFDLADGVANLDVDTDEEGFYDATLYEDGTVEIGGETFEPVPKAFKYLVLNHTLDDEQGEKVRDLLLADRDGSVSAFIYDAVGTGDSGACEWAELPEHEMAEVVAFNVALEEATAGTRHSNVLARHGSVLARHGYETVRGLHVAAGHGPAFGSQEFEELLDYATSRQASCADWAEEDPADVRARARFHAQVTTDPEHGDQVRGWFAWDFDNLFEATGGDPTQVANHL